MQNGKYINQLDEPLLPSSTHSEFVKYIDLSTRICDAMLGYVNNAINKQYSSIACVNMATSGFSDVMSEILNQESGNEVVELAEWREIILASTAKMNKQFEDLA